MTATYASKLHRSGKHALLAVADSGIVGKSFKGDGVQIDVTDSFYGDGRTDEKEVKESMKRMTMGNFTGKNAVELAVREGYVDEDGVTLVGGVPHAQFYDSGLL
jgi:hypothetical protein